VFVPRELSPRSVGPSRWVVLMPDMYKPSPLQPLASKGSTPAGPTLWRHSLLAALCAPLQRTAVQTTLLVRGVTLLEGALAALVAACLLRFADLALAYGVVAGVVGAGVACIVGGVGVACSNKLAGCSNASSQSPGGRDPTLLPFELMDREGTSPMYLTSLPQELRDARPTGTPHSGSVGHHQRPGSLPPALHTPALQGGVGEGDTASQPSPCSDCPILSPFHVPMDAAPSAVLEVSATPPRHGPGVGAGAGAGVAGLALESQSPRGAVPLPGPPALGSPSESHCPSPRRSTTPSTPRAVYAATMQQPQARVSAVGSAMGVGGMTGAGGRGNASPRTVDQAQPRGSAASTAAGNADRINSLGE
jgi:hypothetical protein